jgi:hypothetical protein
MSIDENLPMINNDRVARREPFIRFAVDHEQIMVYDDIRIHTRSPAIDNGTVDRVFGHLCGRHTGAVAVRDYDRMSAEVCFNAPKQYAI